MENAPYVVTALSAPLWLCTKTSYSQLCIPLLSQAPLMLDNTLHSIPASRNHIPPSQQKTKAALPLVQIVVSKAVKGKSP